MNKHVWFAKKKNFIIIIIKIYFIYIRRTFPKATFFQRCNLHFNRNIFRQTQQNLTATVSKFKDFAGFHMVCNLNSQNLKTVKARWSHTSGSECLDTETDSPVSFKMKARFHGKWPGNPIVASTTTMWIRHVHSETSHYGGNSFIQTELGQRFLGAHFGTHLSPLPEGWPK